MLEQFLIWSGLTLVPLIPTYITHKILESSAAFKDSRIRLGGAIAAYFILVVFAFTSYNQLHSDPLSDIRKQIQGEWSCTGKVISAQDGQESERQVESTTYIKINESNKISLNGLSHTGTSWEAEEIILTEEKLVYIFSVPLRAITGFTNLKFGYDNKNKINKLHGYWVITGSKGKGSVICVPAN